VRETRAVPGRRPRWLYAVDEKSFAAKATGSLYKPAPRATLALHAR
jgi:hypothetical protein